MGVRVFFQVEDAIRSWSVTGVQTCAFLISSRRRHTRLVSDWSSDVCSSDLVEPVKLKNYYKTAALGGFVAMFFMLYIYQHFRCIDLSFQLEDLKAKQTQAMADRKSVV